MEAMSATYHNDSLPIIKVPPLSTPLGIPCYKAIQGEGAPGVPLHRFHPASSLYNRHTSISPGTLLPHIPNIPAFHPKHPCLSSETSLPLRRKTLSFYAQDAILCCSRCHLVLLKMASCATEEREFKMKGKDASDERQRCSRR